MIVIDINSLSSIFDPNNSDYEEFYYVLDWVLRQKNACFIYGGTKYKNELRKMINYLKIMSEFKKIGKCVEINSLLIDNDELRLKNICSDTEFDDEHIVAILNISGCKLVCTHDKKAMPYIKRKDFYFDKKSRKIYSSSKNRNLLGNIHISEIKNNI